MNYIEGSASSGVAEVSNPRPDSAVAYFTVEPASASGTGTVTAKPVGAGGYESVIESGVALTIDLSEQASYRIAYPVESVKVTSSVGGDTFTLRVGA